MTSDFFDGHIWDFAGKPICYVPECWLVNWAYYRVRHLSGDFVPTNRCEETIADERRRYWECAEMFRL